MKDSILLLVTACCAALFAWLFWYLVEKIGLDLFVFFVFTALYVDNIRLRREVNKYESH